MSHRYVRGAVQNDWNDPDFLSLDRSQRGCCIWVSLSYKTVNIVVSSLCYLKNLKSVGNSLNSIALNDAAYFFWRFSFSYFGSFFRGPRLHARVWGQRPPIFILVVFVFDTTTKISLNYGKKAPLFLSPFKYKPIKFRTQKSITKRALSCSRTSNW